MTRKPYLSMTATGNVESTCMIRKITPTFLFLALLLVLVPGAWATESRPLPRNSVEDSMVRMLADLREQREAVSHDVNVAYRLIDEALERYVDFPLVAQLALGKYWRSATPEQQRVFTDEFRIMLVRFYSRALMAYVAEKGVPDENIVNFLPDRNDPKEDYATVRTVVTQPGGATIPVDYSLRFRNDIWRVYDIKVEGISIVTSYRNNFAPEAQRNGVQGVIDQLIQRNRQAAESSGLAENAPMSLATGTR